jgi:hypothetical protein
MNSQALISPWTAWFRACKGERTFAIAELASFYGRQSTVGAVMRRIRCSGDCGGRVEAAWLVTGPILNARVRPRRVAPHGISTRSVDDLVQAMGCAGVSKSPGIAAMRRHRRTLAGLSASANRRRLAVCRLDATCVKVRQNGRIISPSRFVIPDLFPAAGG